MRNNRSKIILAEAAPINEVIALLIAFAFLVGMAAFLIHRRRGRKPT